MKKIILLVFQSFIIFSCGPIYYAPNATVVPLFTERHQLASAASTADNGIQLDGAFSISDHVMLSASGSFVRPKEDNMGNGGTGNLIELGGGYFQPVNERFVMGINSLLGFGDMENHYPSANGSVESNLFRWSVFPYVGYRSKIIEAILSTRLVGVHYSSVKGQLTLNNIEQAAYLSSHANQMYVEPALTFRIGYKNVFFQLQDVISINLSDSDFPDDNNTLLAGIYFRYTLGVSTGKQ